MKWPLVSKKERSKGQKAEMPVLIRPGLSSFLALFIGHSLGSEEREINTHPSGGTLGGNISDAYRK